MSARPKKPKSWKFRVTGTEWRVTSVLFSYSSLSLITCFFLGDAMTSDERQRPPAPRHIAIIMDGNGRWARERGLPRIKGHEQGAHSHRAVTEACVGLGVSFLTVYAFSTENWRRPKDETDALMVLLEQFIAQELPELMENNI